MIKRIKLRFLILATVSLLVLLGIIVAGMNLMNYRSVVRESDAVLSVLAGNGGSFPELSDTDSTPDGELSAHGSDEKNAPPDGIKPPQASTDPGKVTVYIFRPECRPRYRLSRAISLSRSTPPAALSRQMSAALHR